MDVTRRIKAARALAGFDSRAALAAKLDAGLGAKTLQKIESGERPVVQRELREIAEACGLPYEFFTVDFAQLPALTGGSTFENAVMAVLRHQGYMVLDGPPGPDMPDIVVRTPEGEILDVDVKTSHVRPTRVVEQPAEAMVDALRSSADAASGDSAGEADPDPETAPAETAGTPPSKARNRGGGGRA